MREISELLADSVDARARSVAGLTPDADDFATIVRTVRRKRAVRRSLQTLAVVPVVGGLAVGAYFGLDALQAPPQGPAATPTITTPAPTPDGDLVTGELQTQLGLPPFFEAPADLAAHVGEGWTALTYRPIGAHNSLGIAQEPVAHALLLVAPDGSVFRTVDLDPALELQLVHWDAASAQARVSWASDPDRPLTLGWLDVFTGELTEDAEQFAQWAAFIGHADDGAELWVEDPAYVDGAYEGGPQVWSIAPDGARRSVASLSFDGVPDVDPSGTQLLSAGELDEFVVVDLATGDSRQLASGPSDLTCLPVGWLDAEAIVSLCYEPVSPEAVAAMDRVDFLEQGAALYRVPVAGGSPEKIHTFVEGEPVPEMWTGVPTGDGGFAFVESSGFPGGCSAGVGAWDGSRARVVLGPGEHSSNVFWVRPGVGSDLLVTASPSCETSGSQGEVHLVDPVNGTARQLAPWVERSPADGIDYWHQTVTSAVVAG